MYEVVKHYNFSPDEDIVYSFDSEPEAMDFLKKDTIYDGRAVKEIYPGTKLGMSPDRKHSRLSTHNENGDTCDWYIRKVN